MFLRSFLPIIFASYAQSACFGIGDQEIKGSCFKFVAQQMTFNDARNWCHYQNPVSYLAFVPDQYTSNFLASYARTAFESDDSNFWIGLSRNSSSSSFTWDNGSPVAYTNFGAKLGQNYMAESLINAKWNAFGENDKNFFVCSYDPATPPTIPTQRMPSTGFTTARPTFTPSTLTTTQQVPTTEKKPCKIGDPTTFLFAYSNDFNPQVVKATWDKRKSDLTGLYSAYGFVRFDVRSEEDIAYFTNFEDATSYLYSHLPDSRLGFGDTKTGSDSLRAIEKFYNNTQFPVCGAISLILSKRYPNDAEISTTVNLVRQHHGHVNAFSSISPSGGTESKTIYNLASETNGMCNFGRDDEFESLKDFCPIYNQRYPIYCSNLRVSQKNTAILRSLDVPTSDEYWVGIVLQDHGPIDVFKSFELSWLNSAYGNKHWKSGSTKAIGVVNADSVTLSPVVYNMELQYAYKTDIDEIIQIRIYGTVRDPDNWLPYCE